LRRSRIEKKGNNHSETLVGIFKMARIQIILLLLIGQNTFGQAVRIDTLKIPARGQSTEIQVNSLKFPVIKTGDRQIDSLINRDLKNRFTHNEFSELSADSTLIRWADENIIYLDFEITYLKDGLISLNISAEGCGAYCTTWRDYFTYSTKTGKHVTINEIVDTAGNFRNIVIADKNKRYEEQRNELKATFLDKNSGLDDDGYKWALARYNECDKSFKLESFALFSDHLEIIEKCTFPNVMKNLTPGIELKYQYSDISKHLKIKN